MNNTGFLRWRQIVPGVVPVSRTTWWRWVRDGIAPKPISLPGRVTVWRKEDIEAFVASFSSQEQREGGK